MDLSPTEDMVIGLLRGEASVDFTLDVAWLGDTWTVSLTSETDGAYAGAGETFRAAMVAAFDVDPPNGGETAPKPVLRVVAGADHRPEPEQDFAPGLSARKCSRRSQNTGSGRLALHPGESVVPRPLHDRSGHVLEARAWPR